jgi:acetyltransferase-like isoleucine patch superfamily enzyme
MIMQKIVRDPWHALQWMVRRGYLAYQLQVLRRTARIGRGVKLCVYAEWTNRSKEQLRIGDRVILGDVVFHIHDRGRVEIGEGTAISGIRIEAAAKVLIGRYCQISYNVDIHDNNGHPIAPETRKGQIEGVHRLGMETSSVYESEIAPVVIGDNVWIGHDATILKGVTVGENAIIGTGSIVTRDVPPNTMVAGNPARVVKEVNPSQCFMTPCDNSLSERSSSFGG